MTAAPVKLIRPEPEPDAAAECQQLPHICARLDTLAVALAAAQARTTADVVAALTKRSPLALIAVAVAGSVDQWLPALIEGIVRALGAL